MKFPIDRRYIAVQILKVCVYYILALTFVLLFLKPKDQIGFFGASLLACITIYYGLFFPANISVKNGTISFKRTDSYEKSEIKITDITRVETTSGLYNTVTLTVKSGVIYHLHPRDVKALEKVLKQ
jgi:hypothetical protein